MSNRQAGDLKSWYSSKRTLPSLFGSLALNEMSKSTPPSIPASAKPMLTAAPAKAPKMTLNSDTSEPDSSRSSK
ncbi:MAG: hypothetical protein AVDCRST_MAG24-556 [uncultured Nocardioidaceae bacterium]|uniref:Uncharacterized protein n=1 Tax=uncultured Nocardioidaceae bacterium TaxID=253824 RepID=A0A6J4L8N5_9ACTN|nr:MAG: hypothetical protein AVDCRST_MAG24-556 [uncultured Nocardioidaceae bacterium]